MAAQGTGHLHPQAGCGEETDKINNSRKKLIKLMWLLSFICVFEFVCSPPFILLYAWADPIFIAHSNTFRFSVEKQFLFLQQLAYG